MHCLRTLHSTLRMTYLIIYLLKENVPLVHRLSKVKLPETTKRKVTKIKTENQKNLSHTDLCHPYHRLDKSILYVAPKDMHALTKAFVLICSELKLNLSSQQLCCRQVTISCLLSNLAQFSWILGMHVSKSEFLRTEHAVLTTWHLKRRCKTKGEECMGAFLHHSHYVVVTF